MKIFVKFQDGFIHEISPTKKDSLFEEFEVEDSDFFINYRFFTVTSEKKLVLNPIYKKLEKNEYVITESLDGTLHLVQPDIEHKDAIFVTFDSPEDQLEVASNLNHYYYIDPKTKTLKIDPVRKELRTVDIYKEKFREERENLFKKWDILKTNSLIGLADPVTEDEKQWYLEMLSFTDNMTKDSTPDTWPVIPKRLRK